MATRTDNELKEASKHLFYEFDMMRRTAWLLAGGHDRVSKNALLESFLVHVRCLVVFLGWRSSNHREDVKATHYVPKWRPQPPPPFIGLFEQISGRIVHLSFDRMRVDPDLADWQVRDITEAVGNETERLVRLIPEALLDACWDGPRPSVFSEHSPITVANTTDAPSAVTLVSDWDNRRK